MERALPRQRQRDYRVLFVTVASAAIVATVDWIQAIWRPAPSYLGPVFDLLAAQPLVGWAGLAVVSLALWLVRHAVTTPALASTPVPPGICSRKSVFPQRRSRSRRLPRDEPMSCRVT